MSTARVSRSMQVGVGARMSDQRPTTDINQKIDDWLGSVIWAASEIRKNIDAGLPENIKQGVFEAINAADDSLGDAMSLIEDGEHGV